MSEPSFSGALSKIGEGLREGASYVAVSTLNGVKHLVVAIKGKPTPIESLEEWQLVHRMERGEVGSDTPVDDIVSHTVTSTNW
tara:strand:- start:49 stop:297 length:249 start_codon:yes stop_codon:yes gene_type:complete